MSDVQVFRFGRGMPPTDAEPLPPREAAAVVLESVRLAWSADRAGVLTMLGLHAASAVAELVQLLWSKDALEDAFEGKPILRQGSRLLVMGGLSVVSVASQSAGFLVQNRVTESVARTAEARVLDVVASLELADVEDPAFQDRVQRAFMGANRHGDMLRRIFGVPQQVSRIATGVAAMTANDRVLVPLAAAGAVAQWKLTGSTHDPMMRAMRMRSREGRETAVLRHYLTGAQAAHELRAFSATDVLRERHDKLAAEAAASQRDVGSKNARREAVANLASRAATGPATARTVLRVAGKQESVAGAVTSNVAARRLNGSFQGLVRSLTGLRQSAAVAKDYTDLVASAPPRIPGPGPHRDFARITVSGLGFTYPGAPAPVLRDVDLEIKRGEVVALVGENGSGKTTLAKLLCCLYRPTQGSIRWDDADLAAFDPAGVREHIAVVFQDFVRYPSLSAAENIGIGSPARFHDRAAIERAAKAAGAHDIVDALPKGYDTVLSRMFGGTDLSTGQWQRVALARAFLRDAPLVVLDEPTAALDPRAERDLFEIVAALYRSRSALLISHRLSSVRFADRICVLASGQITESGTHDELLALDGTYAELFELQARAYR